MNITTALSSGGIVGLFAVSVTLVVWLLRVWMRQNESAGKREQAILSQIETANKEILRARNENELTRMAHNDCERKLNILYLACTQGGIKIPNEIWDKPNPREVK